MHWFFITHPSPNSLHSKLHVTPEYNGNFSSHSDAAVSTSKIRFMRYHKMGWRESVMSEYVCVCVLRSVCLCHCTRAYSHLNLFIVDGVKKICLLLLNPIRVYTYYICITNTSTGARWVVLIIKFRFMLEIRRKTKPRHENGTEECKMGEIANYYGFKR